MIAWIKERSEELRGLYKQFPVGSKLEHCGVSMTVARATYEPYGTGLLCEYADSNGVIRQYTFDGVQLYNMRVEKMKEIDND